MERKIGVVSAHGFGDCLFNIPLINAIGATNNCRVGVAVEPNCADAFINVPAVAEIIHIPCMYQGPEKLAALGYERQLQLTQNIKFFDFRQHDPNHSLIDTARLTGAELGLSFGHRPVIYLTAQELNLKRQFNKPLIAVESVYKSGQSWADETAFAMIVARYARTHTIIWLSNQGAPANTESMLDHSRRELIAYLHRCERFYSVGSGFFCASLALPEQLQPKEIVCLWIDDFYKYEEPLAKLNWHPRISWLHNHTELRKHLCN